MPTVFSLLLLPSIAFAALRGPKPAAALECDGKDFVCNHTDTHFAINSVLLKMIQIIIDVLDNTPPQFSIRNTDTGTDSVQHVQ